MSIPTGGRSAALKPNRTVRVLTAAATVVAVALVAASCSSSKDQAALPDTIPLSQPTTTAVDTWSAPPCDEQPGVGGEVPDGSAPGDLVASTVVPRPAKADGYPTGATVHRILYVSTGADEHDLQLVCGLAAVPDAGPTVADGTARMLAWAHGTIGLQQKCGPSNAPEKAFWAPTAAGIGAIAWGSGFGARKGEPVDGALQHAIDQGWAVSATDYQPNNTYIMGRIAGANVIDAARATSQLIDEEHPSSEVDNYDTIVWGHSQGGHAALWAGQLFESYQDGVPNADAASFTLRGVAGAAPASNLIVQPELQPGLDYGDGLADWEMHEFVSLFGVPISLLEVQFGAVLMSYIFGSWASFSHLNTPAADAEFPAFPLDAAELDLDATTTSSGQETIAKVMSLCAEGADSKLIKSVTSKYHDAATNQLLVPEMWNLPEDYKPGDYFEGNVDEVCGASTDRSVQQWCDWIRWNLPGPAGQHPFPTYPTVDGEPVPVLIAQGADDNVIHCEFPEGADESKLPSGGDCMSVALFDGLRDDSYCPPEGDRGYLRLSVFRPDGKGSPASHLSVAGQIAAASPTDLVFEGSELQKFFSGAFDGTLAPGCSAAIVNPPAQ